MEKYADWIVLCIIVLWAIIYRLFRISFDSIITGIILFIFLIVSVLLIYSDKEKPKKN